jgi:hypothetical protein
LTAALVLVAALAGATDEPLAETCADATARAHYMLPTERYPHGALGDTREWGGLVYDGAVYAGHVLTADYVFEDVAPRLADFNGDCTPEIVVVESSLREGAQLAVYAIDRGRLTKIAATAHVGARFRWLAPAGIADFNGDGGLDIALVRTPHLEGVLEFWTFAAGGLTRIAAAPGFSNHRFGDAQIAGGVRDCGEGPEAVLATLDWSRIVAARPEDGAIRTRVIADGADPMSMAEALSCG